MKHIIKLIILTLFATQAVLFACPADGNPGGTCTGGCGNPAIPSAGMNSSQNAINPDIRQYMKYTEGTITIPFKDFEISTLAAGMPFGITRFYNNRNRRTSAFGFGWNSGITIDIQTLDDKLAEIVTRQGTLIQLTKKTQNNYTGYVNGEYLELQIKNDSTLELTWANGQKWFFNADQKLVRIEDRNGNFQQITYENGRIKQVADSFNHKMDVTYTGDFITSVKDNLGRIYQYQYDNQYNLIRYINPAGEAIGYEYDSRHNLVKINYPNGSSSEIGYSKDEKKKGLIEQIKCPENIVQKQTYEVYFRMDKTEMDEKQAYEVKPSKTAVIDSRGNGTGYAIRNDGHYLEKIDALGNRSVTIENERRQVTSETDANRNV